MPGYSCSGISLAAATLVGMINFINPGFLAANWVVYLIYVAVAVITG